MLQIKQASVLQAHSGVAKVSGKPFNVCVLAIDSQLIKLFSDVAMSEYVGEIVDLEIVLGGRQDLSPSVRIVRVL